MITLAVFGTLTFVEVDPTTMTVMDTLVLSRITIPARVSRRKSQY